MENLWNDNKGKKFTVSAVKMVEARRGRSCC